MKEFVSSLNLSDEVGNAKRIFKNGIQIVQNSMIEISAAKNIDIKPLLILVDDIIKSLNRNSDALIWLCRNKHRDDYIYAHSLSTCILVAACARKLEYDSDQIRDIALGALLGDVGKLRISNEILNKPGKLSRTEFIEMKKHAKYTFALLHHSKSFSDATVLAAAEHHERMDGSGYPRGLVGDAISTEGQLTGIADVYDALISPRCYQTAQEPTETLKMMHGWGDGQFQKKLLKHFIRIVGIYPVGTVVALSNAKLAVVIDHGRDDILLPIVRTVYDLRDKKLISQREDIELEEMNSQNGMKIIQNITRNKFNFNPMSAII